MKLYLIFLSAAALAVAGCLSTPTENYTLFVEVVGKGTVTPQGKHSYAPGTIIDLKAQPAPGFVFSHWTGETSERENPKTSVIADRSKKISAVFVSTEPAIKEAPTGLISNLAPRPQGEGDILYIMIHAISDAQANPRSPYDLGRIAEIFQNYGVEAHYVVDRDGSIYQFVPDHLKARHAGRGSWAGIFNGMNRYSLGIEVLGIGTPAEMADVIGPGPNSRIDPKTRGYTKEQYSALASLVYYLRRKYNIPKANILGHEDYDPARKWDPGSLFDWEKIR